ncbi:MAG TPA: hypothetical protein VJB66_01500 [Candidatus Nanoarchaeia archaeon]|nr:hypothetical protein [Candidatus Nanoarchaeia archaeon]
MRIMRGVLIMCILASLLIVGCQDLIGEAINPFIGEVAIPDAASSRVAIDFSKSTPQTLTITNNIGELPGSDISVRKNGKSRMDIVPSPGIQVFLISKKDIKKVTVSDCSGAAPSFGVGLEKGVIACVGRLPIDGSIEYTGSYAVKNIDGKKLQYRNLGYTRK